MPEPGAPSTPFGQDHGLHNDPFISHSTHAARSPIGQQPVQNASADLANDPFITHSAPLPAQASEMVDMSKDPFMTGQIPDPDERDRLDVDPFLTKDPGHPARVSERKFNFWDLLGEPDKNRTAEMLRDVVMVPWLVFVWVLLLWLLMRHYSERTAGVLTCLIAFLSFGCVAAWLRGRSTKVVPLGAVGMLCLLAVVCGVHFGELGWKGIWRQYWWTNTGYRYERNTAETPAGARGDAAVVSFWGDNGTLAGTMVDSFRSAGYRNGRTYCAAPVLNPVQVGYGGLARVNYWAIGIDCCQPLGSFTCDDSRSVHGAHGVVMLDGGYPCPDCNKDNFMKAIQKAEAAHGLVSAAGALSVRWVADTSSVEVPLAWRAMLFIFLNLVVSFPVCYGLGWLLWYKGFGKGSVNKQWSYAGDAGGNIFVQAANLRGKIFHQ